MEHSIISRILLIVFLALGALYVVFFIVNVVCRTSVQSCRVDSDCGVGTVCVDHGAGEIRCAPPACKSAQTSYDASGIQGAANAVIAWTAKESAQLSHWFLEMKKVRSTQ